VFDISLPPMPMLVGQLVLGLINGGFYALLSLGVAVIFSLMNIPNFVHGALYMLGAFCAWFLLNYLGIGYWPSLVIAPLAVGLLGMLIERFVISRARQLDVAYSFLLTFGIALIIEGTFLRLFGSFGQPYDIPSLLSGGHAIGGAFLPTYHLWVILASALVCFATWYGIERTKYGSYLRAAAENMPLVQAFGINVRRMITVTYGFGAALAALAGVMAAPIYQVSPLMGSSIIIVVFAIVVIGGMGSLLGAIVSGFVLGVLEGLTKLFFPEAANAVVFAFMALVLLVRPAGLFGKADTGLQGAAIHQLADDRVRIGAVARIAGIAVLVVLALVAPLLIYPVFVMKALCFALFACSFNLLAGQLGLLSFGQAAFFGGGAYIAAESAKMWGFPPGLAILTATVAAAGLGLLFGIVAIRRGGIYFTMVTLALAQLVYFCAVEAPFTHGEDGIQAVPRGQLFGLVNLDQPLHMYYFVLAVFAVGFLIIYRVVHSPFGQVLRGIRDNEARTTSLGYRVGYYKLWAFVIAAALAGLAGGTKAIVFQLATLEDAGWGTSGDVILTTLLGGLGTLWGPVVGAFTAVGIESYLAPFGPWVAIAKGILFIGCVLLLRRGIVGELGRLAARLTAPRHAADGSVPPGALAETAGTGTPTLP
jgi:branched-chain amino acid transport system permease protein